MLNVFYNNASVTLINRNNVTSYKYIKIVITGCS